MSHDECVTILLMIGLELGLEPTLPYLSPLLVGEKLLIGANFASAGIGILNDTGFQFVSVTLSNFTFKKRVTLYY